MENTDSPLYLGRAKKETSARDKFAVKNTLALVQSCVSSEYLMKPQLQGNVNGKVYGFLYTS
jgi:hypothetical protein